MLYKNMYYYLVSIIALSSIIVFHECGHYIAALFFGVPAPLFSIGFGPQLFGIKIGNTLFQVALLPLGGYVLLDPLLLRAQPYFAHVIIICAGVFCNMLLAYCIFVYQALQKQKKIANIFQAGFITFVHTLKNFGSAGKTIFKKENRQNIIGPIGIVCAAADSLKMGNGSFLNLIALISINIGIFNLLPIPFLDGGQVAQLTLQSLYGNLPPVLMNILMLLFFILFLMLFVRISIHDVKKNILKK